MFLSRLANRIPRWESHIAFWDWVIRALLGVGALVVGYWTAAQAWAEGVITPLGTLGYVAVVLLVALALAMMFALFAMGWSKLRPARRIAGQPHKTPVSTGTENKSLQVVSGKYFHNRSIPLDGFHYINCAFEECTLFYDGTLTQLSNVEFRGTMNIATHDSKIECMLTFLFDIGMLRGRGFHSDRGEVKPSSLIVLDDNGSPVDTGPKKQP